MTSASMAQPIRFHHDCRRIALCALAITPATAVPGDKPQVVAGWTQTSASSYDAWAAARANQGAWSAYAFD